MLGLGLKAKFFGLGLEAQVLVLGLAASGHGLGLDLVPCGILTSLFGSEAKIGTDELDRVTEVTCKIKHLQNICKNVLEVGTCKIKH